MANEFTINLFYNCWPIYRIPPIYLHPRDRCPPGQGYVNWALFSVPQYSVTDWSPSFLLKDLVVTEHNNLSPATASVEVGTVIGTFSFGYDSDSASQ